jgi:hypothetical protein
VVASEGEHAWLGAPNVTFAAVIVVVAIFMLYKSLRT